MDLAEQRLEIKLPFHSLQYPWLQEAVRTHAAGFSEVNPVRRVNNAYLDTPDLAHYQDNRAGYSDRNKVRVRWYGLSDSHVPAALEIKQRRQSVNAKLRHALAGDWDLESGRDWTEILREVRLQLDVALLAAVGAAWRPVLVTRYWREYFATADGEVRVTLDRRQELYSQLASLRPNLRWRLPPPDIAVLEVKAPLTARQRVLDITSTLPARVRSNSKYAIAVERALNA